MISVRSAENLKWSRIQKGYGRSDEEADLKSDFGHITDRDPAGMAALLGNGDVKITISMEEAD